jgi:hypothetical protein
MQDNTQSKLIYSYNRKGQRKGDDSEVNGKISYKNFEHQGLWYSTVLWRRKNGFSLNSAWTSYHWRPPHSCGS